jgi:hypothetical protein
MHQCCRFPWRHKARCRQDHFRPGALLLRFGQFSNQAGASALPHFGGKLPHGFLRDGAAFATGKRSAGIIEGRQKRDALAFPFLPQRERFLYRLFLAAQPSRFNGAVNECSLILRKLHFHRCDSSSHRTPEEKENRLWDPRRRRHCMCSSCGTTC